MTNCTIRNAGDDSWSVQPNDYLILKAAPLRTGAHPGLGIVAGVGAGTATGTAGTPTGDRANETLRWNLVVASRVSFRGAFYVGDVLSTGLGGPSATVVDATPKTLRLDDTRLGLDPAVVTRVMNAKPYSLWQVGGASARLLNLTVILSTAPSDAPPWTAQRQTTLGGMSPLTTVGGMSPLITVGVSLYAKPSNLPL